MLEFDIALLAVIARGLVTAAFVAGVGALMERASPFIGGIVLALPIVTAPAYVFLILHEPADFVPQAALGSLATIGAVLMFLVTAIALLRRFPMPLSLLGALSAWFTTGLVIRLLPTSLGISLLVLGICGLIAWASGRGVPMTAPAARSRSPLYEILLRGVGAGALVAILSAVAHILGPKVAGIFASFPIALLTVCSFLPKRLDTAGIRAALRASQIGMVSHIPFFCSLALLGPRIGLMPAFFAGILASLGVAVTLALLRRRHLRKAP